MKEQGSGNRDQGSGIGVPLKDGLWRANPSAGVGSEAAARPSLSFTGPHPDILYRRSHPQGMLTASIHGSHARVTVSLHRRWAVLVCFVPTDSQLARAAEWAIHAGDVARRVFATAVVAAVLWLAVEIVRAFLPGGAAWLVMGDH